MGTDTDTKLCLLVACAGICAGCSAASAGASARVEHAPNTRLLATFVPKRLGAATTIGLTLKIAQPTDPTPPPLAGVAS